MKSPLDVEALDVLLNVIKAIAPEIIVNQRILVSIKLDQLPAILPLGPVDQSSAVRVQVVHEVEVVPADRLGGVVWLDAVEHLDEVGGVEGAQDGEPVVVRGEVAPAGHIGIDGVGGLEEDAAGEGEDGVAEDSGQTFELGIPVVEDQGAEGGAVLRDGLIGVDETVDDAFVGGWEENLLQVCAEFGLCGDVRLEEGEEGAFVFLVPRDEGDFGVFALLDEDVRGRCENTAIGPGEV